VIVHHLISLRLSLADESFEVLSVLLLYVLLPFLQVEIRGLCE
jgi:hypothetical protein